MLTRAGGGGGAPGGPFGGGGGPPLGGGGGGGGGGDTCSSFCRGGSHPFREELFFPGRSSYFAIIIDNFFLTIE